MTDSLLQSIYGPVDSAAVAYTIANEGRRWLPCGRLSVLGLQRHRCRLLAVSGVDVVDRRAAICGALEELATYVAMSGEDLRYPDERGPLAPELEQTIERLVHESPTRQLLAVPLQMPSSTSEDERGQTVGVLVLEEFTRQADMQQLRDKLSQVQSHFALALGHAVARERAPLAGLSRRIERWQQATHPHRLLLSLLVSLPILVLVAASVISVELRVPARGQLQPVVRRDIFASEDGVIEKLLVEHGDAVGEGQLLVEMSQSELDYAISQLDGQLRTTQQQLQAVTARRWDANQDAVQDEDENRLAAEQERLQQVVTGLEQQRQILQQRQQLLQLRSPVAGEIVTWDASQKLLKRPVRRGQRLLSVVDPQGPWIAELDVADRDIRHVVTAQGDGQVRRPVTFLLATDPASTYHGEVLEIAQVTQGEESPTVRVKVQVNGDQIPFKRPGATLVARIGCGQQPLLYRWCRHLWDAARTRFWW